MVTNYLRARLPGVDAAVVRWDVGGGGRIQQKSKGVAQVM